MRRILLFRHVLRFALLVIITTWPRVVNGLEASGKSSGAAVDERPSNVLGSVCDRDADQPEGCIAKLLAGYPGDGIGWIENGTQLAIALAAHPEQFFLAAAKNQIAFRHWLRDLPQGTFQILARKDTIQAEITAAQLEKLRSLMLKATASVSTSESSKALARDVEKTLRDIRIASAY